MQLILDTQTNFRFRVKNGQWETYKNLIIGENVVHQLDTNNSVQLIIYLDNVSEFARTIRSIYLRDKEVHSPDLNIFHVVNSSQLQQALIKPEPFCLEDLLHRVLMYLSGRIGNMPVHSGEGRLAVDGRTSVDERIFRVEQAISTAHPEEITPAFLARQVCLSESRLRALFKQITGVPLHRYILWNKIRFATNQIMAGDSVLEAAMDAGFTDSSHFHKMMVKEFGISPSGFLKENRSNDQIICDLVD